MNTNSQDLTSHWEHNGERFTFTWAGNIDVESTRVYGLAFIPDGRMILVTDRSQDDYYWLPGGGVEMGELPEEGLAREFQEEVGGRLLDSERIGVQRVESSTGRVEHHAFYWCRVELDETFSPEHEIVDFLLVTPDEFLDCLFWGRSDPKGGVLLEAAKGVERERAQD